MHNVHKNKGEEIMYNNSKLEFDFNNVTAELEKKNIKELRESIGMSRQEFCTVFDVPYRTLQSWEHGTREMSALTKRLLAYFILNEKNKQNINNTEYDEDGIPKLEYIQVGEFLLPNLALDKVDGYIGVWGIRRKNFLKEHKPAVYSSMLLMDELNQHLIDTQKAADERRNC